MLGKTDQQLTPGPLADQYLADDATVIRTGEPLLHRCELCRDEVGLPDWYETNKFPIKDDRGRVIGIMGTSRWCGGFAPDGTTGSRITPALQLLRADLTRLPPPDDLAKACHLSVRQLQRCFEEAFGLSPRNFWMKCRIRAACETLRTGDDTLAALAFRLGFCDQSSFTAHFHKHTGQTPSSFRSAARSTAELRPVTKARS